MDKVTKDGESQTVVRKRKMIQDTTHHRYHSSGPLFAFGVGTHPRTGVNSPVRNVPIDVLQQISVLVNPERCFALVTPIQNNTSADMLSVSFISVTNNRIMRHCTIPSIMALGTKLCFGVQKSQKCVQNNIDIAFPTQDRVVIRQLAHGTSHGLLVVAKLFPFEILFQCTKRIWNAEIYGTHVLYGYKYNLYVVDLDGHVVDAQFCSCDVHYKISKNLFVVYGKQLYDITKNTLLPIPTNEFVDEETHKKMFVRFEGSYGTTIYVKVQKFVEDDINSRRYHTQLLGAFDIPTGACIWNISSFKPNTIISICGLFVDMTKQLDTSTIRFDVIVPPSKQNNCSQQTTFDVEGTTHKMCFNTPSWLVFVIGTEQQEDKVLVAMRHTRDDHLEMHTICVESIKHMIFLDEETGLLLVQTQKGEMLLANVCLERIVGHFDGRVIFESHNKGVNICGCMFPLIKPEDWCIDTGTNGIMDSFTSIPIKATKSGSCGFLVPVQNQ
jgi:hypothetical protein